jgi:hypothetical protein
MTVTITRESVLSILSSQGTEQTASVEEFHKSALRTFKSESGKAEKALSTGTLAASLDTFLAERTDRLVKRGVRKGKGVPGVTGKEWADTYGVGESTVTMWRALGWSVAEVGIDPAEDNPEIGVLSTWRLLAFKGCATNKVVAEAIYSADATPESVREACLTVRQPDGKVKRDDSATGTPKVGAGSEEMTLADQINTDPVGVALDTLKIVRDACKAIAHENTEGWAKVEDMLSTILREETAARVKSATERNSNRSARTGQRKSA